MLKQKISNLIRSHFATPSDILNLQIKIREEMLNYLALHCKDSGVTTEKYCDSNIIVSLTTYGKRLQQVYLTIESLMQQSMKPNKIVLWLDYSFQDKRLPQLLKQQHNR